MTTNTDKAIRLTLQIFPAEALTQFTEAARLRLESKLIESISEGLYDPESDSCQAGGFGTWAGKRCVYFLLKEDLINTLIRKIYSNNPEEHEYLLHFFWDHLTELIDPPSDWLVRVLKAKLRAGNKRFYEKLSAEQRYGRSEWVKPFEKELKEFKEVEPTPNVEDDDNIPF